MMSNVMPIEWRCRKFILKKFKMQKKGKKCKNEVFELKMSDILMKKWTWWGAAFLS
jgi:hypothetical protein